MAGKRPDHRTQEFSMRAAAFAVLVISTGSAHAETLMISGKSGYLSEWEVTASVTATDIGAKRGFSGPIRLTHTGLCMTNGPVEKMGEIRLQTSGWLHPTMQATLSLDGARCTFTGALSDGYAGYMDCPDSKGVPLTIFLK